MQKKHGNPTLVLTSAEAHGRRLIVNEAESQDTVWRSHVLSAGRDSVAVNVWDGSFVNDAVGCAVLPEGRYAVYVEGPRSKRQHLQDFSVERREVFSGAFDGERQKWFDSTAQWFEHGSWRDEGDGIVAENGEAYLFAEGEQHGVLVGRFDVDRSGEPTTLGLIAKLYSAFFHIRLSLTCEKGLVLVRLLRYGGQADDGAVIEEIASQRVAPVADDSHVLQWRFNGLRQEVCLDGEHILEAQVAYMGGVTVVGLFAESSGASWKSFSMNSTQSVPTQRIDRPQYQAVIRPGNVQQLRFPGSDSPETNVFWESGLQFGHIGGSEIKFTQGASLVTPFAGDVLTQVQWSGPMPKFVERSDDVRGWAHGSACFYPHRIVLADYVLPWTVRSVGPDLDMNSRVLDGPARVALAGERSFRDWSLPDDGAMQFLQLTDCGHTYPVCVIFPLKLGTEKWWLEVVIANLLHVEGEQAAAMFAWRCPYGLTASHDFRAAPTVIGVEYGFSIVTQWCHCADQDTVERETLNLCEDWCQPMSVRARVGGTVCYEVEKDQPAELAQMRGCFDLAKGAYRLMAEGGRTVIEVDPEGVERKSVALWVGGMEAGRLECRLDTRLLAEGQDFQQQELPDGDRLILLTMPLKAPFAFEAKII